MTREQIREFDDSAQLISACSSDLVDYLRGLDAASARLPRLVLTGGRLGQALVSALAQSGSGFDSTSVWITWGDERFVPLTSSDSNAGEAFRRFPLLQESDHFVYPVSGELVECRDSADASLAGFLNAEQSGPLFDLVLLGIGEDGHVASIFPNQPGGESGPTGLVASVAGSPKPPANRLTLTAAALNRSRAVWFLASGAEKHEPVRQSFNPDSEIPAAKIRGIDDTRWYLDRAAVAGE